MQLIFLFLLLLYLFFVSRKITQGLYTFFFILTGSRKISVIIMSLFVLPGTLIHELSHFLFAAILRVKTGRLTVIPRIEENGGVRTGSLELEKTDPFRFSIIGIAPLLIGLIIIFFTGKFFLNNDPFQPTSYFLLPTSILYLYILFSISVTMFMSKRDLEGLKIAGPITLIFIISLYIIGVRLFVEKNLAGQINSAITELNHYLIICSVLDFLVFAVLRSCTILYLKITGKRIKEA